MGNRVVTLAGVSDAIPPKKRGQLKVYESVLLPGKLLLYQAAHINTFRRGYSRLFNQNEFYVPQQSRLILDLGVE